MKACLLLENYMTGSLFMVIQTFIRRLGQRIVQRTYLHSGRCNWRQVKGSYFDRTKPANQRRLYEVYFPHDYVQYHPWGQLPMGTRHRALELEVRKVCHVTHQKEADQIRQDDGQYRFTPHKKSGKAYIPDGHPLGESYRCTTNEVPNADTSYQQIPPTETVLPGYYSWWGLAVDADTIKRDHPHLAQLAGALPDYLKPFPASVYGTKAFVSTFSQLLQSYADSRGCKIGDLHLRMGGTLRYKHEIAYVVIICTSSDQTAPEAYPITRNQDHVFNPNGLVDGTGKVTDPEKGKIIDPDLTRVPTFTTQYYVDGTKDKVRSSYETLDFALYLGDDKVQENLVFLDGTLTPVDIAPEHHRCIRTQPRQVQGERKWVCPDKNTT